MTREDYFDRGPRPSPQAIHRRLGAEITEGGYAHDGSARSASNSIAPERRLGVLTAHTNVLKDIANRLDGQVTSIEGFANRVAGPVPEEARTGHGEYDTSTELGQIEWVQHQIIDMVQRLADVAGRLECIA